MNKKFLFVVLIISFSLVLLSACSNNTELPGQPTKTKTEQPQAAETPESTPMPLTERPSQIYLYESEEKAEYALRSFIQIPMGMTWGPDDCLYIADWVGHHVVKVEKDGTASDLGLWTTIVSLQEDGPSNLTFDSKGNLYLCNDRYMYRRDSSGKVEILFGERGKSLGGIAVSQSDELYYSEQIEENCRILKWNPNGENEVIISNLKNVISMVFGLNGKLYLTQMGCHDVIEVDVASGETKIFAKEVCGFDPAFLAVDQQGDLWVRGIWTLYQISPEGISKPFVVDGESYPDGPYNWHTSAGIAIDDDGGVWVASYNSKLAYLKPTSSNADPDFKMEVVSHGFEASDLALDSKGAIYGTDLNTKQVIKINPDKTTEVFSYFGTDGRAAIAIDQNDNVYLGLPNGEVMAAAKDGTLSHYASLLTRRMVFGANGVLYAITGDNNGATSIVSITGIDTITTLATEIDGISLGNGNANISPALDSGLYIYTENERNLFFVDFEGNGYLITNIEVGWGSGPSDLAASPVNGDIYLIPFGPYSLFKIDKQGNYTKIAAGMVGDPWGMIVSQNGEYIYVAESGAIDIIPINTN